MRTLFYRLCPIVQVVISAIHYKINFVVICTSMHRSLDSGKDLILMFDTVSAVNPISQSYHPIPPNPYSDVFFWLFPPNQKENKSITVGNGLASFSSLSFFSLSLSLLSFAADIISTVEFNHDGELLATGDKGGRVVIFQREEQVRVIGLQVLELLCVFRKKQKCTFCEAQ